MINKKEFDVIIIGGSYSGLSAGMALGRSLRSVLIIDSGYPCNRQTPHSHNFITQDGKTPIEISLLAKQQVQKYDTVNFYNGLAVKGEKTDNGFEITTQTDEIFIAKKLLFSSGIKDIMPAIKGFSECWGITAIHCPYCHGYEVKNQKTGILGNGEHGFEFSKLISNWTNDLTLFTNGVSTLTPEQSEKIKNKNIKLVETEIEAFEHNNGYIETIVFKNGTKENIKAIYTRPVFEQNCLIAQKLGCDLNEQGHIAIDPFQKTTVQGIYAAGDNSSLMRSVSNAVATGSFAGIMINKEIIQEEF